MGKSPDAFRTISEVADWLDTQAHVLRFWESKFTQVKPVKRAGGRRYYRPADMLLLGGIKKLLHDDGMTIKGAQKLLREKGTKYVSGLSQPIDGEEDSIEEIELAEVTPPPIEEERGTVLSFERREDPVAEEDEDATTPETPEADADEEGDLFSLTAPQPEEPPALETKTDETPEKHEEEEEKLSPEDMPSFVQRLTPKPAAQEGAPEPIAEIPAETAEPDIDSAPEPPVTPSDTSIEDDTSDAPDEVDSPPEPGPSPLAEIATMTAIAPENRAEVAAILDRLAALCERIEAAENA